MGSVTGRATGGWKMKKKSEVYCFRPNGLKAAGRKEGRSVLLVAGWLAVFHCGYRPYCLADVKSVLRAESAALEGVKSDQTDQTRPRVPTESPVFP